jgi:hypothetical protein
MRLRMSGRCHLYGKLRHHWGWANACEHMDVSLGKVIEQHVQRAQRLCFGAAS